MSASKLAQRISEVEAEIAAETQALATAEHKAEEARRVLAGDELLHVISEAEARKRRQQIEANLGERRKRLATLRDGLSEIERRALDEREREHRDELCRAPEVEELRHKLRSLDERADELTREAEKIAASRSTELPYPEVGDIGLGEADWLLDTDRGYIEQLNAYRRHEPSHRRRPPLIPTPRACPRCGGSMAGRAPQARVCAKCAEEKKLENTAAYRKRQREKRRTTLG